VIALELTPDDIRNRSFKSRWVSGYDMDEVESFLARVATEFENLILENETLKERVKGTEHELEEFRVKRRNLEDALISSQRVIDEMKANAKKEAENILKEAEMQADRWITDANMQVQDIKRELHQLEMLRKDYEFKFRSLLESHLEQLNTLIAKTKRDGRDTPAPRPEATNRI
jgi:cell division initiation protein